MSQDFVQSNRNASASRSGWFEVDKEGLAKILERQGKEFALLELIQNAWDEPIRKIRNGECPSRLSPGYALAKNSATVLRKYPTSVWRI